MTTSTYRNTGITDTKEQARHITKMIRYAEQRLRRRFNWLQHQNALGMAIFLGSALAMVGVTTLYFYEMIPGWLTVILNCIFASFLHELEHDLIHSLYFKGKWQEKLMMWGVWIFRGATISPFYRKEIHLHHHKVSGQQDDIEEQILGNGAPFGIKKIIGWLDGRLSYLLYFRKIKKTSPSFRPKAFIRSAFPVQTLFSLMWDAFLLYHATMITTAIFGWALPAGLESFLAVAGPVLNFIAIVYLVPNMLQRVCLHFITTNMHYFGDIKPGREGLVQQCQILNAWYFIPFHIFCFNFGSTHGIHHFVANQPFYLRQMIAGTSHAAMIKYGVRHNDVANIFRGNRYSLEKKQVAQQVPAAA